MTDKQFLQRMNKMVKKTHWVKGSLEKVLKYEKDPETKQFCRLENGDFKPGKMGHCIMGLVGIQAGIRPDIYPSLELKVAKHPQAARVTERLWRALPKKPPGSRGVTNMAYDLEEYNDGYATTREDIVALIDRAIENK